VVPPYLGLVAVGTIRAGRVSSSRLADGRNQWTRNYHDGRIPRRKPHRVVLARYLRRAGRPFCRRFDPRFGRTHALKKAKRAILEPEAGPSLALKCEGTGTGYAGSKRCEPDVIDRRIERPGYDKSYRCSLLAERNFRRL
jgi:hypothetical protein